MSPRSSRPAAGSPATAVTAAALAGLLALAATTGEAWLVAVAVVLVQVLVAAAPRPVASTRRGEGADGPVATGGAVTGPVVAGSLVATALAHDPGLLAGATGTRSTRDALVSSGVVAGVLLGCFVVVALVLLTQMLRRDGRRHLVESAAAAVLLGVVATFAAGWMAAATASVASDVVPAAGLAVVVALLVRCAPGDGVVVGSAAVVLGGAAGAVVPLVVDGLGTWQLGLSVGLAAAACGLLGQALGRSWLGTGAGADRPETWVLPAAVAVALAGPVAHLGAQLAVLAL